MTHEILERESQKEKPKDRKFIKLLGKPRSEESDLDSKAFFSQIPQITFDFKRNNDNCLGHKMAVLCLLHSPWLSGEK